MWITFFFKVNSLIGRSAVVADRICCYASRTSDDDFADRRAFFGGHQSEQHWLARAIAIGFHPER